jgi:hypothetical protein
MRRIGCFVLGSAVTGGLRMCGALRHCGSPAPSACVAVQARQQGQASAESALVQELQGKLRASEAQVAALQRELELLRQEKDMELTSLRKQHEAALASAAVGRAPSPSLLSPSSYCRGQWFPLLLHHAMVGARFFQDHSRVAVAIVRQGSRPLLHSFCAAGVELVHAAAPAAPPPLRRPC